MPLLPGKLRLFGLGLRLVLSPPGSLAQVQLLCTLPPQVTKAWWPRAQCISFSFWIGGPFLRNRLWVLGWGHESGGGIAGFIAFLLYCYSAALRF